MLSFMLLGALWRRPRLAEPAERPLPDGLQRVLLSTVLRAVGGGLGFFLFVVVLLAALAGENDSRENLAPTFVYVIFWLGLVPVVELFGNVWTVLSPWRAAADAYVWAARRLGAEPRALSRYPAGWGLWPGAVLLGAWTALELAYVDPANARALALAILLYSYVTWLGMAVYGREA
ncbi:MAG: hypothetical protein ABR583_08885 [Gaiellaceae bacterium]